MARLLDHSDYSRSAELGDRCAFNVDGEEHTGVIVRVGNTRSWGHAVSDRDGQRYEWTAGEDGFRLL